MTFEETVFIETRNLNIGDHWRFQHWMGTKLALDLGCQLFMDKMESLCINGYFKAIKDNTVCHYEVLKKPK